MLYASVDKDIRGPFQIENVPTSLALPCGPVERRIIVELQGLRRERERLKMGKGHHGVNCC